MNEYEGIKTETTVVMDRAAWNEVIDTAARFHLDMSGAEFLELLERGEFDDPDQGPAGLMAVLALVPHPGPR